MTRGAARPAGAAGWRPRASAPLGLQIAVLLLSSLVVAQVVTLALTLLWPPPAPRQYRLEDVAAALSGAPARTHGTRPLVRTLRSEPPSFRSAGWLVSERSRHDLARLVGAPEADVRLLFYSPLPFAGATGLAALNTSFRAGPSHVEAGWGLERVAYLQQGPGGPPGFGGGRDGGASGQGGAFGGFLPGGIVRGGFEGGPSTDGHGGRGRTRGGGRGGSGEGAHGRSGGGPRGGEAPDRPIPSAPTTIDPPGSHDGRFLGLGDIAPALRFAPRAPLPPAAAPAPPLTGGSVAASAGGTSQVAPDAVETTPARARSREVSPSERQAAAEPVAPRAPSVSASAPSTPARVGEDEGERVAGLGVIAPAPLVAARTGEVGGYLARPPQPQGRGLFGLAAAPEVQGDFVAALRVGPHSWAVVEPRPEPFPNSWQRRVLLWFALALMAVGPLGWLFARRLARPLQDFALAAERLGRDPSGEAPALDGPAEIGRAARAFNVMQMRLKRFVDDRTAMVGAISHDLRTPLARMRFRMERAPDGLKDGMLHDIGQMEEMISSVLVFIREASEPSVRERVDLRSIVECVVDDAALVGGDAVLDVGDPMSVEVDALGVQRVLTNLVDNALKYGARARLRMYAEGDEAVAEVVDEGPGLAPEELERVFLPFYRSEGARTLNTGGIGLGLAVSRSIARAHGGDVRLYSAGERGVRAELRLPLAATG